MDGTELHVAERVFRCISPPFTLGLPLSLAYPLCLCSAKTMRCRERTKKPVDVYPVSDSYHYPLPPGLKAGTEVKLVHFDHGYWTVELEGQQFLVFQTRIDSGFEYELKGRWLPESDPRVQAALGRETLVNARAYSCVEGGCVNPPV